MEVVDVKTTREMECSSVRVRDIFDMSSSLCTFRTDGVCVSCSYTGLCVRASACLQVVMSHWGVSWCGS